MATNKRKIIHIHHPDITILIILYIFLVLSQYTPDFFSYLGPIIYIVLSPAFNMS